MKHTFFPPLAFDSDEGHNAFTVNWYSKNLESMQEISLLEVATKANQHCYRFLWLRTFHPPVAITVIVDEEHTGEVTLKVTDGMGGYGPGQIVMDEKYSASKENIERFLGLLEKADFWNMPTKENKLGMDGAQWILEGVKDGNYHIVDRWSPKEGSFRNVALNMIQLAALNVESVY